MCRMSEKIGDIARKVPTPRLQGSVNIMDALDQMDLCETNIIAIECEDLFVGVFRRADFNKCVVRQNLNPKETTLYEVMTINTPTVSPEVSVRETYEHMIAHKWEYMPVVDLGTLWGIVPLQSLGQDVIRAYEDLQAENRMILNYIQRGESYGLSDYHH